MPEIRKISKHYGQLKVFEDFSIKFTEKQVNCILGPSGCGKTTLLNLLAGLLKPDSGEISGIDRSKISYVFQEPRLLPWKTVRGNIEFTLLDKVKPEESTMIINKYLKIMELEEYQGYYPGQLSGGMKQRVSLARAFSFPSEIILMDEPFKGLDYRLKQSLQKSFLEMWRDDRRTIIYVTHDVDEAIELGQIIFLFSRQPVKILATFNGEELREGKVDKRDIIKLM